MLELSCMLDANNWWAFVFVTFEFFLLNGQKGLNINGSLTHKSILQYNTVNTHTLLWFGFHLLVPHEKKKKTKNKKEGKLSMGWWISH